MRGNPILRAVCLAVAMCLTSLLVASVLGNARPDPSGVPDSPPSPTSTLVPTYLTIKLSAPAESLQFVEPSGRVITVPVASRLIEHEAELEIVDNHWNPTLRIVWTSPDDHKFLRLDLEPDNHPSASLHFDSSQSSEARPIEISFAPAL